MAVASVLDTSMFDLFECPVCFNFIQPPIHQCPNGHILCSDCKSKLRDNLCPTCRGSMGSTIRSLTLEKVIAALNLPCKYRKVGCVEWFKYDQKRAHEEECRYRPYKCPFPTCPGGVSGNAETLVTHLRTDHQTGFQKGCDIDSLFTKLNLQENKEIKSFNLDVYSCFSKHFFLQCEARDSQKNCIYIYLTLMGEEMEANKFYYQLEIENGDRKMVWEGSPRSMRVGSNQIRDSNHGLILHQSMAGLFAEPNTDPLKIGLQLGLRVKGFIWKRASEAGSLSCKRYPRHNY